VSQQRPRASAVTGSPSAREPSKVSSLACHHMRLQVRADTPKQVPARVSSRLTENDRSILGRLLSNHVSSTSSTHESVGDRSSQPAADLEAIRQSGSSTSSAASSSSSSSRSDSNRVSRFRSRLSAYLDANRRVLSAGGNAFDSLLGRLHAIPAVEREIEQVTSIPDGACCLLTAFSPDRIISTFLMNNCYQMVDNQRVGRVSYHLAEIREVLDRLFHGLLTNESIRCA
jgi:hypothetical protein